MRSTCSRSLSRSRRRLGTCALAVFLAGVAGVAASRAQDETGAVAELGRDAHSVLDGGLAYLAGNQGADGSSGTDTRESVRLATTSLAGLAFLAAGNTPSRGPFRENVKHSLDYVLSKATHDASSYVGFGHPDKEEAGRMHAHGFAMLFLAEAYGMLVPSSEGEDPQTRNRRDPSPLAREVRTTLEGAVKLSLASQTLRGGWGYAFKGEGTGLDEASTTITQIQGLRAARNAGIQVPSKPIAQAVEYVKQCMNDRGECRYSLTMDQGDRTSFELSAAAVSTLHASGAYGAEKLKVGLAYMRRQIQSHDKPTAAAENYYFYGNLYAAQAMFQAGGADWTTWFKGAQEDLVAKAHHRGEQVYWADPRNFGDAYATASACLILSIPLRYLPIFER